MTDADDLTDDLRQILAEHPIIDWSDGTFTCAGCAQRGGYSGGPKGWTPDEVLAHQAAELAADIRAKQAEAWADGYAIAAYDYDAAAVSVAEMTEHEANPFRRKAAQ